MNRDPYDGKPYYCTLCGAGFGEVMACEEPDCQLESAEHAHQRAVQKEKKMKKVEYMKLLFAVAILVASVNGAGAASFTIPSFTLNGPPSTGTVCTPTAASSGLASAAPAGTVMFNCVVSPSGWVGGVSLTDPALQVTSLSGNTFNLSLVAAGVAQTYAVGTGTTAP